MFDRNLKSLDIKVIVAYKWWGILLIVGSGLFVALRQRQLSSAATD